MLGISQRTPRYKIARMRERVSRPEATLGIDHEQRKYPLSKSVADLLSQIRAHHKAEQSGGLIRSDRSGVGGIGQVNESARELCNPNKSTLSTMSMTSSRQVQS